jgi:hypothetical protein
VTIRVPAVAVLRKNLSTHKKGVKFSRVNVLTRDGFRCCYCGKKRGPRELNYDRSITSSLSTTNMTGTSRRPRASSGATVIRHATNSKRMACIRGAKGSRARGVTLE